VAAAQLSGGRGSLAARTSGRRWDTLGHWRSAEGDEAPRGGGLAGGGREASVDGGWFTEEEAAKDEAFSGVGAGGATRGRGADARGRLRRWWFTQTVAVSGERGGARRGQVEQDIGEAMAMETKWERVSLTAGDKGGGTWGGG
jgi:hypothetical protein